MAEPDLHLVDRELSDLEIRTLIELKQPVFFSDDRHFREALKPVQVKLLFEEEQKQRINYDIMTKMIRAGEKVFMGKSLNTLFAEDHFNIWFYSKFRIYFLIRNLFYQLELIRNYSDEYNSIIWYTVVSADELKPFLPDNVLIRQRGVVQRPYTLKEKATIALLLLRRSIFSDISVKKFRKAQHILLDTTLTSTVLDRQTLKAKKGNYILNNVFEAAPDNFIGLKNGGFPPKGVDITGFYKEADRAKNPGFAYLNAESIYREVPLILGRYRSIKKSFNRITDLLQASREQESDPFVRLILYLIGTLRPTLWMLYIQYRLYLRFFRKCEAKTISGINENSPDVKVITDAAKFHGIKVLGIQHGAIHRLHPAYMHSPSEVEAGILPNRTLVWGANWKDILTSAGGYPSDAVIVTGHPRTDVIPDLLKLTADDGHAFRLLFASQPQRDPQLRRNTALDVFTACREAGVEVILRPHPGEFDYKTYYGEIAEAAGLDNIRIEKDQDLYLAIHASSAVITSFSTVGAEALFFKKPLIVYDPLKQDIQGYIAKGIGKRVSNSKELVTLLLNMTGGEEHSDSEAMDVFVRENAYLIDGKASNRIIEAILSTGA